jgi:hypothetical protein
MYGVGGGNLDFASKLMKEGINSTISERKSPIEKFPHANDSSAFNSTP